MSEKQNICKFSDSYNSGGDLFAFQFVYETAPQRLGVKRHYHAFVCHLVSEGSAVFNDGQESRLLTAGDVFFCFPSLEFSLQPDENFHYLYISFVGNEASCLLESMGITRTDSVRLGFGDMIPVWFDGLRKCQSENLSFMAKSMLFYAFALFRSDSGRRPLGEESSSYTVVSDITAEIEQNYANENLSLEKLCQAFGYSTKYISRCFRKTTGMCFSDYLKSCRIRHACVLLEETRKTVQEISAEVGYRDPLYFSKVFKKIMLISPAKYREEVSLIL